MARRMYSPSGTRASLSLDVPLRAKPPDPVVTFRSRMEDQLWSVDDHDQDQERYFLYLPRNLSYCHLCADVVKQHVQTKVKHLSSKLAEMGLTIPTVTAAQGIRKPVNKKLAQSSFWLPREKIPSFEAKLKDELFSSSTSSTDSDECSFSSSTSGQKCPPEAALSQSPDTGNELPSILRKSNAKAKSFPPLKKCSGKKVVRFADSLGLELESVRHMMVSDKPPVVPSRAFSDLHHVVNSLELDSDFQNPSSWVDFDFRLRRQRVCLHSIRPTYTTVYGLVTVLNLTFHKNVFVRYTTNGWRSYNDVKAVYVPPQDDEDPHQDRDNFSFNIFTSPNDFYGMRELKLIFAVCFRSEDGGENWDNNEGTNYSLSGFYKPITLSAQFKHTWVHFL